MRISDWSSDVCSSELHLCGIGTKLRRRAATGFRIRKTHRKIELRFAARVVRPQAARLHLGIGERFFQRVDTTQATVGFGAERFPLFARARLEQEGQRTRSAERRVGKGGVSKCRTRGS